MELEKAKSYKDLDVWKKSMDLVVMIYQVTESFPTDERFGLISQMRRCAISIPSNIAEGSRRGTSKDRGRFLNIAFSSGAELETQIEVAKRLKYLSTNNYHEINELLNEVMRMLNKMLSNLGVF